MEVHSLSLSIYLPGTSLSFIFWWLKPPKQGSFPIKTRGPIWVPGIIYLHPQQPIKASKRPQEHSPPSALMGQWPPGVMLMQEERAATYKNSALVVVKTAMSKRVE